MGEIEEIIIAMVAIVIAFAIVLGGFGVFFSKEGISVLIIVAFTVGIAFLAHEMGHKWAAEQFGIASRFVLWPPGILIMLLFAPFGFVFAAPGAVYIFGRQMSRRENGLISLSGPLINFVLYGIFLTVLLGTSTFGIELSTVVRVICVLGLQINAWLALFNLLPFFILDGAKVFHWNRGAWAAAFVGAVGMLFAVGAFAT